MAAAVGPMAGPCNSRYACAIRLMDFLFRCAEAQQRRRNPLRPKDAAASIPLCQAETVCQAGGRGERAKSVVRRQGRKPSLRIDVGVLLLPAACLPPTPCQSNGIRHTASGLIAELLVRRQAGISTRLGARARRVFRTEPVRWRRSAAARWKAPDFVLSRHGQIAILRHLS